MPSGRLLSHCAPIAAAAALCLLACRTPSPEPALDTAEERFSYSVGARLGADLRNSHHPVDPELARRGFEDGLAGSAVLSDTEIAAALEAGVKQQLEAERSAQDERAQTAEREGRAYLEQNRARPGVVELPSGLQYEVLREGDGPTPGAEDWVTCEYRGTLVDGTVFDDTGERGAPPTFPVTSVIDGFEEALLHMRTGARWRLAIPAELGYGARGSGSKIPPNSTLILEVELVSIGAAPEDESARDAR